MTKTHGYKDIPLSQLEKHEISIRLRNAKMRRDNRLEADEWKKDIAAMIGRIRNESE